MSGKMICPDCGHPMDSFMTKNLNEVSDNKYKSYLICENCEKVYDAEL